MTTRQPGIPERSYICKCLSYMAFMVYHGMELSAAGDYPQAVAGRAAAAIWCVSIPTQSKSRPVCGNSGLDWNVRYCVYVAKS